MIPLCRSPHPGRLLRLLLIGLALAVLPNGGAYADPRYAIAMHGAPALPADFDHLPYVDPTAPRSGRLVLAMQGTFDTLNPFSVTGTPAASIRGYVIESLMTRSQDEPFTLYGLLAESIDTPEDRSYVEFTLRPEARFSDGTPVTADDVLFSWQLLRDHGLPNHRSYYGKVKSATALDARTVRFDLAEVNDRELPLILGLMPVLSKKATDPARFGRTGFQPLVGSGPYLIADVKPSEQVTYRRDPNYWGERLAVNRGLYNFDEVRIDYYRDANTMFEAFKKGLYDVRPETDPGRWTAGYDFPAARDGKVVQESFTTGIPRGMNAFVFNTRRQVFADRRVREALIDLFDFEWANRNLFFGSYSRTGSYFEGSELSARGRAATDKERALLAPYADDVRTDVMEGLWQPPVTDGSGQDRIQQRRAMDLLQQAGWSLDRGKLQRDGKSFRFELLVVTKDQERIALTYARWLQRAGIEADVRLVDAIQFRQRLNQYDYDMIPYFWFASLSPGNEQLHYWGSAEASIEGGRNYMGVKSAGVDAMIAALLSATSQEDFVAAVRALDRVLMSGFYVVPLFHLRDQWIARRDYIRHPPTTPLYGPVFDAWWRAPG